MLIWSTVQSIIRKVIVKRRLSNLYTEVVQTLNYWNGMQPIKK